jgi:hypothetical protein
MALEQFQTNELPEEIPVDIPAQVSEIPKEATKEKVFADDASVRLQQKRREYDLHLQNLIDKASQRQLNYNPKLLALGAGLLTPGKTGNFFEGLGLGAKGYMEAGEKEVQTEMERAKLENELRTGQIGQLEKDYALQKDLEGKQFLRDVMSGKIDESGALIKPTTLAGSDKMTVPDAYALINSAQTKGKRITPAMLAAAPTKETRDFLEKMIDNQQKEDKLKQEEYGSTKTTLPVIGEPTETITIKQVKEIERLNQATRGMPAPEREAIFNQYYQDQGILGKRNVISTTGKITEQFETPQQKATRVAGDTETVKELAKSNVKDIESLETRRDSSVDQINSAKAVYSIATDPKTKNAFGILARPGLAATVGEILREPLKFGDISLGVANIENIIRKAGGTQEEINAAAVVARSMAQLELGFSQIFKGQGQVSDNERLIVRNVGPQISDNPKVAALKAESIIARAEYDSALANKFAQWQESHPNGSVRQFKGSTEYNSIKVGYDNKLGNILSKYGYTPAKIESDKPSTQPKKGGSLWQAIQNAKESE